QELDDLGFKRGADGFIRDASGERTTLGVNATVTQINQKSMASVADYWQRLGFAVDQVTIPLQRQNDLEFFVSFPGFLVLRGNRIGAQFLNQNGSRAALPEKGFNGINRGRYINPEYDALMRSEEHTSELQSLAYLVCRLLLE